MSHVVELLGDHDHDGFDCGNAELNDWLCRHAAGATGQGTRTYVLMAGVKTVGYFAIAPCHVTRGQAPKKIARGATAQIPAILLAKLALDRSLQGKGMGAELLNSALTVIVNSARRVGGRIVVVDAIDDDAAAFYRHHGFMPLPDDSHRLVLKLSRAAKSLGVPWP
ncbi:MAG TPA: GNAT family N-acetyltransferase [Acidimicrobiales bacterium]|nr:GNAT family N-acetyltransferase [Acidimicrobiales bacterium]